MKTINNFIIEALKISSKSKVNAKDGLSFDQFKHKIMTTYDLNEEMFKELSDNYDNTFKYSISINSLYTLKEYNFKLISQDDDNDELFNFGADFINHPSRIKKYTSFDHIYTNKKVDLTVLYHDNDELGDFLYFLDYQHDAYDIYQLIK